MFASIHPPSAPLPGRLPGGHRRAWWHGLGWLTLIGLGALTLRAGVSREYQIKAAFLYNFTKFVEWPAARFANETSPIVIGVLGRNPFDGELERIVAGRNVNGRAVVVKLVATIDDVPPVHVLFVPGGEEKHLPAAAWQNAAIVAVGETEDFAVLGGTITFTREADKVRFAIDLASAERVGLKISAQLLKLATAVRRKI